MGGTEKFSVPVIEWQNTPVSWYIAIQILINILLRNLHFMASCNCWATVKYLLSNKFSSTSWLLVIVLFVKLLPSQYTCDFSYVCWNPKQYYGVSKLYSVRQKYLSFTVLRISIRIALYYVWCIYVVFLYTDYYRVQNT